MTESTSVPPEPTAVAPTPAAPEPAPPARSRSWRSQALRWTTGLLVVFALGLGATWLAQVRPLQQQVAVLEGAQATSLASLAELQAQVAQMEAVRAENVALTVGQAKLEQSFALLNARVGTLKAQLVLAAGGGVQQAAQALAGADAELAALEQAVAGSQQVSVQTLRERLALAMSELESDPFAARRDLEVLANGLETMEKALSGG
jgi:hypothetical protein